MTSNWPSHTDYQDSIQNPHICFEDEVLKTSEVKVDMLGLPKVMSGNFASVYSVTTGGDRWAIRCFVRQVLGQQGRYARLSQHLMGLGLDCMVTSDYLLRGIKVRNEWYPIVKMQWVDGLPLNNFVEDNIDQPEIIKGLVPKWVRLMSGLREHQLAHGDLQHGNIMVTPNAEFRLVDYDGMYTPAFRGKSPELGHANFQHPRRTPDFYNEALDNFAGLVIYTTFMAIAEETEIFQKYYTGDNLILLSSDYRNPTQSPAIQRLKQHKNETVKQLGELIERCCLADVSAVPDFSAIAEAVEKNTLPALLASLPAVGAAPATQAPAGGTWWAGGGDAPAFETGSPVAKAAPAGAAPTPAARPAPKPAASSPRPTTPSARPGVGGVAAKPAGPTGWPAQPARPVAKPAPAPAPQPAPVAADNTKLYIIIGVCGLGFLILMYALSKML
ncbi:MAG TPA: hypothetical protein VK968_07040 [Roseimicrobium sp.]|nr:hypothetical protein [Roseimicrobium sp.]